MQDLGSERACKDRGKVRFDTHTQEIVWWGMRETVTHEKIMFFLGVLWVCFKKVHNNREQSGQDRKCWKCYWFSASCTHMCLLLTTWGKSKGALLFCVDIEFSRIKQDMVMKWDTKLNPVRVNSLQYKITKKENCSHWSSEGWQAEFSMSPNESQKTW